MRMTIDADTVLPAGKLPGELLSALLARYTRPDPRVLIGPGVGRDAAAIAFGDRTLVVKSDPVTFATADAGWYLVNVNANDLACMGATPRWLLTTALFPDGATTPTLVEETFASLDAAASAIGVALVGGHCEITVGLERLILVGQLLGEAEPGELYDLRSARSGDAVLLCGGIAVEGTALLAREAADSLSDLDADLLTRAQNFLNTPGISVLPAAHALRAARVPVRGLHDPTEGGLATALSELAAATGLGIEIEDARINVYPECVEICKALSLDPLGLIASGALLAVVPPDGVSQAQRALVDAGLRCARVGAVTHAHAGAWLLRDGRREPMPTFAVDEIARYFSEQGR
jgi:hydrogenase expression/formation protein HypE